MSDWTPSQTVGPFFHFGLCFDAGASLVAPDAPGRITIEGRIVDGAGAPVPDALLEIWQADAQGRYRSAGGAQGAEATNADGFGRVPTDAEGRFSISTIKPGAVAGPEGRTQAPHILVNVFGRGLLTPQLTRLYFDDESTNQDDPILALVPVARRDTLIARRIDEGCYRWDLVLQGARETVFFDVR